MWGGIIATGLTVGSIGYSLWQAMNKSDAEIQREVDQKTRESLRIATAAKRGTRTAREDVLKNSKLREGQALADDLLSALSDFQQDHTITMDTPEIAAMKQQMGAMTGSPLPMGGGGAPMPEPLAPDEHYPEGEATSGGIDPVLDRGRSLIGSPAMAMQLVQRRRLKGQTPTDFDMVGIPT